LRSARRRCLRGSGAQCSVRSSAAGAISGDTFSFFALVEAARMRYALKGAAQRCVAMKSCRGVERDGRNFSGFAPYVTDVPMRSRLPVRAKCRNAAEDDDRRY